MCAIITMFLNIFTKFWFTSTKDKIIIIVIVLFILIIILKNEWSLKTISINILK